MAYLSPPKNCAEQSMMIQLSVLITEHQKSQKMSSLVNVCTLIKALSCAKYFKDYLQYRESLNRVKVIKVYPKFFSPYLKLHYLRLLFTSD